MICCFMNFHEKESLNDLAHHFDNEINYAIYNGCTTFVSGRKYPEDKIFEERVYLAIENNPNKKINFVGVDIPNESTLKKFFIFISDWEIYAHI